NNRCFGNRLFVKWFNSSNKTTANPNGTCQGITDGNGIILDKNRSSNFVGKFLVANNLCVNNGGAGIQTFITNNVDIINNTCYRNSTSPDLSSGEIFANNSTNILIQNNISVSSPGERAFEGAGTNNIQFVNNLFFGPTVTISGTTITSTGTIINDGTYVPTGPSRTVSSNIPVGSNIVADPQFVNPTLSWTTATDFTLKTNPLSPAINTGGGLPSSIVTALGTTDLAGNPRVVSTLDLGAYESNFTPCGVATGLSTSGVSSTGATLA
ncbi:choice-of-anchor Q domain-containing protein, partial [Hymenobacter terrenus]|uniref:choice-of-anchor Q domain-containing protein n=1 Tax=Hymenobacter terrenus TaxID=1629124 RepID=UPI000619FCB6